METLLAPSEAVGVMVKLAVAVVELTTVVPLVMTPAPEARTEVAPLRLVPMSVT